MQKLFAVCAAIGSVVVLTACGFERSTGLTAPTGPTAVVTPANGPRSVADASTGSLLGTWASERPISASATTITLATCSNIQLTITSQTAAQAAGTLSMDCPVGLAVSGNISLQLGGATIPLTWTGTATTSGSPACPFSLTGTGTPLGGEMFRLDYGGPTCFGPVQGSDNLRFVSRSSTPTPTPPTPPPTNHVGPGTLSANRAEQVVLATAREFPRFTRVFGSDQEALDAAAELLRRTIWHMQLAGYQAARQRNPSGLISSDKLSIFVDGAWHCYDIFSLGFAGRASVVQFLEVPLPNPVQDPGIPD